MGHIMTRVSVAVLLLGLACCFVPSAAVRRLHNHRDFKDVLATAGVRPVIIDFFSQSCGPCHMIAPVFEALSKEFKGRAYFRKVDVNQNYETSSACNVRSMPTFHFYVEGKLRHQFSGADERGLRHYTQQLVAEADRLDVEVSKEDLKAFYEQYDAAKATDASIDDIFEKHSANFPKMVRILKKKYGAGPKTTPRKRPAKTDDAPSSRKSNRGAADNGKPNLEKASDEELRNEIDRREEEQAEKNAAAEEEKLSNNMCTRYRKRHSGATEKVVIMGSGPAGLAAALYAARAGLCPLMVAPAVGGQLMGKGVDVENYPGMAMANGGDMVKIMKKQARSFMADVKDDIVTSVDLSKSPFVLTTNDSTTISTHSIIIATGADSRWLGVPGEHDFRGAGVSSCATCDGFLYKNRPCVVIGGGDTAMEDALVLARVCSTVTVVHRRNAFRASSVLQKRVLTHPKITVLWNKTVDSFVGEKATVAEADGAPAEGDATSADASASQPAAAAGGLTGMMVKDVHSGEVSSVETAAAFIAIGHDPNTALFKGQLDMNDVGYLSTVGKSTYTSVPGVFAAGDVADYVYRQAITSAGTGAMAALDAERWLSETGKGSDAERPVEDFSKWRVKDLRSEINDRGLNCNGCFEKSDYIKALTEAMAM